MKPEKAIELNEESERSLRSHKFIDHADAVALGNEALKRLLTESPYPSAYQRELLPGETKD